jgi:hypothetical protein
MPKFVDINKTSRLHEDGRMENTRSGGGVTAGTYRNPICRGIYFYYRLAEGKNLNISKAMMKHFDILFIPTNEWFARELVFIKVFNDKHKKEVRAARRAIEKQNHKKRKAMAALLDGTITSDEAEMILGVETVSIILSGEPVTGVMTKRIVYNPFNEFGNTDLSELSPEAWGFNNATEEKQQVEASR